MKSREFISRQMPVREKVNRTESTELVIFDIDDTLLHTTAKINVVKDGEIVTSLTNQEFNNYELKPGEEFDFGEFRNARKFEEESVPIGPMLDKLRGDLAAGKNVVMLTARADFDDQKTVWRTFKRHGIDINKDVHLFRAGNQPGGASPAAKKAIHVRDWLNDGRFKKVVMYDDSEKNLTVFKSLQKEFPEIKFEAHHVSASGDTTKFEASYPGNIGIMEISLFYKMAKEEQKKLFKELIAKGKKGLAWKLVQDVVGVKLQGMEENFADGKVKGKSRPGRVKKAGASCKGSVSDLRAKARKYGGEKGKMYHWCANMKSGRNK
jgi:hypothetical protein